MKTEPTPGAFEIMSKWRSFEILNWLDTTNIGTARALFESGAELEKQRDELLRVCRLFVNCQNYAMDRGDGVATTSYELRSALTEAGIAIANAGGNP